jgi:hypothetical protein
MGTSVALAQTKAGLPVFARKTLCHLDAVAVEGTVFSDARFIDVDLPTDAAGMLTSVGYALKIPVISGCKKLHFTPR